MDVSINLQPNPWENGTPTWHIRVKDSVAKLQGEIRENNRV